MARQWVDDGPESGMCVGWAFGRSVLVASAGKANLALRRLVPLLNDGSLRARTQAHVDAVDAKIGFAIEWRNRHIAHRDLDLSLGRSPKPLPKAEVEQIDFLLDEMAATLNDISQHFFRSSTAFRSASIIHDAEDLLYVLRDGLRREEIRQQHLEAGEYRLEDWDDDAPPV